MSYGVLRRIGWFRLGNRATCFIIQCELDAEHVKQNTESDITMTYFHIK
jgi:hypothetical protein